MVVFDLSSANNFGAIAINPLKQPYPEYDIIYRSCKLKQKRASVVLVI